MTRLLPRVVTCLFLGAATVPLVAWAMSLFTPYSGAGAFKVSFGSDVSYYAPAGESAMWFFTDRCAAGRREIASGRIPAEIMIDAARAVTVDELPSWSAMRSIAPSGALPFGQGTYVDLVYGWPLPALHERHLVRTPSVVETSGAIDVPASLRELGPGHTLPARPLAGPFAVDAVALGAVWFIVLFGYGLGRRAVRTARGRCPACGYDLAGATPTGCPECGRGRAA